MPADLPPSVLADPAAALRDRGVNPPAGLPPELLLDFARVTHLLWVAGELVPVDQFRIDPGDEGLLFGRGVWESTRTVGGVPWMWTAHVGRLRRTCELVRIDLDPTRLPAAEQVTGYVRSLTATQDVVLRLNATAGRPGKPGLVWMSAAPMPAAPASLRLLSVRSPFEKGHAYLTLKTFQYAARLRIGQQAHQAGYDTALLVDADGNLQEAAHANLFVRLPEGWLTPTADGGLLPGTVRQHLLERSPVPIRETPVPHARLSEVREAFVTNSNLGLVPVTQIDQFQLQVGAETWRLKQWLEPPPAAGVQYRFVDRGLVAR